jgi:hypothetical protein
MEGCLYNGQVSTPGGGGIGDPRERPREKVLADVRDGILSARQAHEVYGVPLGPVLSAAEAVATVSERFILLPVRQYCSLYNYLYTNKYSISWLVSYREALGLLG